LRNSLASLAICLASLASCLTFTTQVDAAANDPLLAQQWGIFAIGADRVWSVTTGKGVTVAVVDSGSGPHPDLADNLLPGRSFFSSVETQDGNDIDTSGHGSHVAGIIAAAANNGIGGSGVAPNAKILPIKVLDQIGQGDARDVAAGVRFAADNGAKVINLSLGGTTESPSLTQAIQYATDKGALVVAAAGNGGATDAPKWPAALDLTIAVTAINPSKNAASFDQRGDYIDIAAPGTDILSTSRGIYKAEKCLLEEPRMCFESGTSMAAGFVAGAAALLFAAEPRMTNTQVRDILLRTATDIGEPGRDQTFGFGVINLVAAMAELQRLYPPVNAPQIAAAGRVGETLVANLDSISEVINVKWFRCESTGPAAAEIPADCIAIIKASKRSYRTTQADSRRTIRIGIEYTRAGTKQFAVSNAVGPFLPIWQIMSEVKLASSTPLAKLFNSSSSGSRTYKVLSGTCRVMGTRLMAPGKPSVCRVRMNVAARAPYPKLTIVRDISVQ
jgi:type VII secretion-associated serine protease mycosin